MTQEYDGSQIQVLKGLQAVRKRPAMYIGDTDKKGLHHLIWEILDNSIDEAMAGHAKSVTVTLHEDGETVSVEDDGRGIPVDIHPTEKISSLQVAMTVLHAGGKMTSTASGYMASGGLHGVGASCVNALSDSMTVEVHRDGHLYRQEYSKGDPLTKVEKVRKLNKEEKQTGTKSTWHPDDTIFKYGIKIDEKEINKKLKETAYLNRGLKLIFTNQVTNTTVEYQHHNGISDYVLYLVENKNGIFPDSPIYGLRKLDPIQVEIAIAWTDDDDDRLFSYANNIPTHEGGRHVDGFKSSLTRTLNTLARATNPPLLKEKDDNLDGKDYQEGMSAIISVRLPQPEFVGQTKGRLATLEAEKAVSTATNEILIDFFDHNPKILVKVIEKAQLAQRARRAAKDASAALKKKSILGGGKIPGKLSDCRSSDLALNEIFIVEGDSAAGSAVDGRNSDTQAILSLKGKIINAEKSDIADMMKNEEVLNLMISIGTGIKDNFDINKLNYGKVIIMSDADDDGYHIRTLLLCFFYRFMKPLVEKGHIYVAQAPLYMIERKVDPIYCWNDAELKHGLETVGGKSKIKRFKGLGEMNSEQLAFTTMEKGTRHLLQVSMDDAVEAERILTVLMGKNVQARKQHITNNVNNALVAVAS